MKKLNKQEITAIVNKTEEQYNKEIEKATKNTKLTKEQESFIAHLKELQNLGVKIFEVEQEYKDLGKSSFEQYKEQYPKSNIPDITDFPIIRYVTIYDYNKWCKKTIQTTTDIFIQENMGLPPFAHICGNIYDDVVLASISKDFDVNEFISKTIKNFIKK